jgi:hypothetical protein
MGPAQQCGRLQVSAYVAHLHVAQMVAMQNPRHGADLQLALFA